MLNPDEDTFILKGWEHNPATSGKIWYFIHDEERYDNKLLYCTVSIKESKCLAVSKEHRFYDPVKATEEQVHEKQNNLMDAKHIRFSHASTGELKRILTLKVIDYQELQLTLTTGINNREGCAVDA